MLCIICNSHVYQAILSRGYFIIPWLYRFEALSWCDCMCGRCSARATITFAWRRGGAGNGGGGDNGQCVCEGRGEIYMVLCTRYPHCKICQVRGTHPIKFHAPYAHDIYFGAFVEHIPLSFHALVAPSISNISPKAPWLVRTTAPPLKQKGRLTRPMFIPRLSASSAPAKAQGLPVASPRSSQVRQHDLPDRLPPKHPSPAHTPR